MGRSDEASERERVWKLLSDAGLIDVPPEKFSDRIKEAKDAVIGRLSELLKVPNDVQERESAACSLATLRRLETTVRRTEEPLGPNDRKHAG